MPDDIASAFAAYNLQLNREEKALAINERTMTHYAPTDPPAGARELTLAEVATGVFPTGIGGGPWRWPEAVFVALGDSFDISRDFGGDWVEHAALMMRAFATLYANGYRLVGPAPKES